MAYANKVIIIGNATREPELKFSPKGTAVCKLGMALSRKYTTETGEKKEEVTFVDVDFFGKTAEIVGKFVRKGAPLYVSGRLRLDQWEDKATGQKRSKLGIVGDEMQLLDRKPQDGEAAPAAAPAPRVAAPAPRPSAPARVAAPAVEDDSDSVPF